MLPEIDPAVAEAGIGSAAEQEGSIDGEEGGEGGVYPVAAVDVPADPGAAQAKDGGSQDQTPGLSGGEAEEKLDRNEVDAKHPANPQHQESNSRPQKRYSKEDFRIAVVAGAGNRQQIARALDISEQAVAKRIAGDPELCAIYGRGVIDAVADPITKLDLETYRAALKVYGVSAMHLEKQRALDALAAGNSDRMLAISLRVAHQSYVGLLHDLDEVAAAVKERLNGVAMPDGTTVPHEPEQQAALAKVFVDCVKERGRGAAIMMAGIETIVKMSAAAKGDGPGEAGKKKAGWGPMKRVVHADIPPDAEG